MAIKAVLFDLGETLLNYGEVEVDDLFKRGAQQTYQYLAKLPCRKQLPDFTRYHRRHVRFIKWHVVWATLSRREFDCISLLGKKYREWGLELQPEQMAELAWLWYEPLGKLATVEPGVHQSLQQIAEMGLKMGVISNVFLPAAVLERQLEKFDLLRFFPVRVYSSAAVYRKPHPAIYRGALAKLGVAPAEAVMVGDKLVEDIRGARRLGMGAIFKRGLLNQQRHPGRGVPVIDRISELPEVLRRMSSQETGASS